MEGRNVTYEMFLKGKQHVEFASGVQRHQSFIHVQVVSNVTFQTWRSLLCIKPPIKV